MDYPNKTFTNAGADLMAADDAKGIKTDIDTAIVSQSLPDESGDPLAEVTLDDFDNPMTFPLDNRKHNGATFQVETVLRNKGLTADYPVNMIGLLAHPDGETNQQSTLLSVATADDPFVLPKETNTPFSFRIGIGLTYKNAENLTATLSDAGTVSVQDLKDFKSWARNILLITVGAGIDQAAASYAVDHKALQNLSSNYSGFMSNATSTINSGFTADRSVITEGAKVTSKALNATINQTGVGIAKASAQISQLSSNQQSFASSANSYLTSTISSNNEYATSASSVNNRILYAVVNQNNEDFIICQNKLNSVNSNQQELSSSASSTADSNSNHAESANNLNKRIAIAALNQAAANNYLLRTKILGKE